MSIIGIFGRNGAGKSACAVGRFVVPAWKAGIRFVSNITLYPEELGLPRDLYVPLGHAEESLPRIGRHVRHLCVFCKKQVRFDTCRDCGVPAVDVPRMFDAQTLWSITDNEGCGLLIDEVTTEFPSRGTLNVPPELQAITKQFRKPRIAPVVLTDTSYARVDLLLREVLTTVIHAEPWSPFGLFRSPPTIPNGWPEHRAYRWTAFDGQAYEAADRSGRLGAIDPQPVRWGPRGWLRAPYRLMWKPSKVRELHSAYDSVSGVELADRIACKVCGGDFKRAACKDVAKHKDQMRAEALAKIEHGDPQFPITPDVLEAAGLVTEAEALDRGTLEVVA